MTDASKGPDDRSWAVPVVGILVVVVGVAAVGSLVLFIPTTSCACSPPPPSPTTTPDHLLAEAHVSEAAENQVTVRFADKRNAAALLIVAAPANESSGGDWASRSPAPSSSTSTADTATATGRPGTRTDTRSGTASPAPENATLANGSVSVESRSGPVRVTDRGVRIEAEGAAVTLGIESNASVVVRAVALPPVDTEFEPRVVETWNGTGT